MSYKTNNKAFAVYVITDKPGGTLYIGMTNELKKRIWEHINNLQVGFSSRYQLKKLVYFESHETAESAIKREKQLKHYNRVWKIRLIKSKNPNWEDLYSSL